MRGSGARFGAVLTVLVGGILLSSAGCDDRPTPPPPAAAQRNDDNSAESGPARPTTQELVSGPYKHLQLTPLPLTADVPQSWDVKSPVENIHALKGPIPYSPHDLLIQLTTQRRQSGDRFDRMLNYAKKDAEARHVTHFDVRDGSGGMKIIEEQSDYAGEGATTQSTAQPGASAESSAGSPPPLISWKLLYFVPRGGDYDVYELNFINLTHDAYEQNKPMLRKIVDSVAFDPSAPAPPAPTPGAPESIVPAPPGR